MGEFRSRIGNASLKVHKWADGKVSIELKPHEGEIDCDAARGCVGLYPEDVEKLVNCLSAKLS
ncbi:MAG: hypothetical protein AABW79_02840 [Nanoarchaeota archaeon]